MDKEPIPKPEIKEYGILKIGNNVTNSIYNWKGKLIRLYEHSSGKIIGVVEVEFNGQKRKEEEFADNLT